MNRMRLLVGVTVLLLLAAAASAQPFVGDEILSDLLQPRTAVLDIAAPAAAMAKDRDGVVIAWTMRNAAGTNAVHVARLDAAGRVMAPAVEITPVTVGKAVDAYAPSIAVSPAGTGFTLAWIEIFKLPAGFPGSAVYCELDADLKPSFPRALAIVGATEITAPAIVRSGQRTWISGANAVWEIRSGGSIGQVLDAGAPVSDMAATPDYPQVVSGQSIQTGWICTGDPTCSLGGPFIGYCDEACRIYRYVYELRFVSLFTGLAMRTMTFKSGSRPALESDGRDVLVVWMNGDQVAGGTVSAVRLSATSFAGVEQNLQGGQDIGTFGPDLESARPDIATDGERFVVVWSTKTPAEDHDIQGAVLDRQGHVTPLSIGATDADERNPSILVTAPGNFLVAYEKLSNGERRLATRTVKFNTRRRAAR